MNFLSHIWNFFVYLWVFLSTIIIDCWTSIINGIGEFRKEKQKLGGFEAFKRVLQKKRFARIWAFIAMGFAVAALWCLSFTKRFNFHRFPNIKEARSGDIYFLILVIVFTIMHLGVLILAPQIRTFRYVRAQPIPVVMALGATVLAYIPVACAIDGSLGDENLDWWAFKTTICFTFEFFCLHMAVLPHFDYMVVHMSLGILSTIVLGITQKHSNSLRIFWVFLTALLTVLILSIHHWLTIPVTCVDDGFTIEDARPPERQNEDWSQHVPPPPQQPSWKDKVIWHLKGGLGHGIGLVLWLVMVALLFIRK